MIDLSDPNSPDYWFDLGARWCWRCLRLTRHYGHTNGDPVCVRCALLRDGAEEEKRKKK